MGVREFYPLIRDCDCEFAIAGGVRVNRANRDGHTLLMAAAEKGDAELVLMLLDRGADPAAIDKKGRTARSLAQASGNHRVAELLARGGRIGVR